MKRIIISLLLLAPMYALGKEAMGAERIRTKLQEMKRLARDPRLAEDAETGSLTAQLFLASAQGDFTAAEDILKNKSVSPNVTDSFGNTALHYAKNLKMIKLLRKYGANLNAQNDDGIARLHMDVVLGRYFTIDYLLNNGAETTLATQGGVTPLHLSTIISYFSDPTDAALVALGVESK